MSTRRSSRPVVWRRGLIAAAVGMALAHGAVYAQESAGSINGRAKAGATVSVTNPSIGITRTATARGDGGYQVPALPPGSYVVTVTNPDGSKDTRTIEVAAGSGSVVNFDDTQQITVTGVREASGFVYLAIKGFNDRTSVEKFRNTLLQVPESELPELEEGEYYRFQLIGLQVFDREGAALGEVAEIIETGATDVYRITSPEKTDLLLAAMPDVILEIDVAAKRMTVDPPDWR